MLITRGLRGLVLLGLREVDVLLLQVVISADRSQRIEAGGAVLQRQPHLVQLQLDLVYRLGSEVADVEQVLFAARYQLRHRMDALSLEAVVGPYRQVEILDRQRQVGRQLLIDRGWTDLNAFGINIQLARETEQFDQSATRGRNRIPGPDRRLGLDVQDQPIEVGALLDAGRLNLVGHLKHR